MSESIPSPAADVATQAPSQSVEDVLQELEQYGITSRQSTVYEWGGYKYSSCSDAIAAAKRAAR